MDLSTRYLGFTLPHPLMPGASPLVDDLDTVRRLEDAGAAAIVMHSLFEEQIAAERAANREAFTRHLDGDAEARSYFPASADFALGPDAYLDQIRKIKEAVRVPVIASLNGVTATGWLDHARLIEQAGADALELNVYHLPTRSDESASEVERRLVQLVHTVRGSVRLPLAVKLSPFYSALPHLTSQLCDAGADALVLFNRFYQPDIDPDALETVPTLRLSDPSELRLRWLAILHGRTRAELAASGGVHSVSDVVRAVMAGASAVQVVSALLRSGPGHLTALVEGLRQWLEAHEYHSLGQALGSMSLLRCPDPSAFERGNYMRILQSWGADRR